MALASINRIDELFHRPAGEDDMVRYNVVSAALERVRRDLDYLEITCGEYVPIAQDYAARVRNRVAEQREGPEGVPALTEDESNEFDAQRRLSVLLHLRIETFYLFAQRLFDHLVFAADVIFAPAPITIGRHRTLRANLDKLAATGHVAEPPGEFWSLYDEVTERVKDFRDDYVAHTHHARLTKSTMLRFDEGAPRIHLGVMFPKEGEVLDVASEPLDDLLPLIDRWASVWLDYLEPLLLPDAT